MKLAQTVMGRWTPPPKLTISQWANKYRKLSSESSSEPGDYSTDKAPYQAGIMDAVSDRQTERVVVMAGSQLGKSEILNNITGYYMDYDPCPMLIIQPTIQMAEDYSKDRIAPMIRDTPNLRRLFNLKTRSGDNTLLHKLFPGGNVTLIGANSPSALASKPKRIVLPDEIDRYPISAGDEGDPLTLAVRRTATFHNRKIVIVSTPTIKGRSRIESLYEESDKRRFYLLCYHCGEWFTLKWSRVTWEDDKEKNATYMCEHCDAIIEEQKKMELLRSGKWIAENEFKGTAGFHLNELYSPWRKWWEIVKDFKEAKKSPHTLKAWINTSLGETFEERGDSPEHRNLYNRREEYKAQIPLRGLVLTAGVDVQRNRLEVQLICYGRDKERFVIDYRVIPGNTETEEPWLELDKLMNEEFEHESGQMMMIRALAIDSGYLPQRVYDWARKYPANKVLVVKGMDSQQSIISTAKNLDVGKTGKKRRYGLKIWTVGTDITKSEVYASLKIQKPTDEELRVSNGRYPSNFMHFPMTCNEEYFKQLTAEALIPRTVRGYTKYSWVKVYERNEALDTAVYSRAAAAFIGIDRWKDHHWKTLEAQWVRISPDQIQVFEEPQVAPEELPPQIIEKENVQEVQQPPPKVDSPPARQIQRERPIKKKSSWLRR